MEAAVKEEKEVETPFDVFDDYNPVDKIVRKYCQCLSIRQIITMSLNLCYS